MKGFGLRASSFHTISTSIRLKAAQSASAKKLEFFQLLKIPEGRDPDLNT